MPRQPQLPELSPAQREIMEIVWDQVEVSAREVRAVLSKHRPVARNTVRTLLQRMEEKGWLKHRVAGRTHHYSAAIGRQVTMGHKVAELVETVCGGSPEALVSALLDYRGLTDDELRRIRGMLNTAKRKAAREQGSG